MKAHGRQTGAVRYFLVAIVVNIPLFRPTNRFPMLKLDNELKSAIARMPAAEKDKLLLRLVAKDKKLVNRLIFELLEDGSTRDMRADALRISIAQGLDQSSKHSYMTPGYLLLELRHWNARIAEHVHATKDKLGEVTLTLFLLAEAFRVFNEMLKEFPAARSATFAPYVVKRASAILKKAEKLHEDYFVEFRRDAQELLEHLWGFPPTAHLAKAYGLQRYWEG